MTAERTTRPEGGLERVGQWLAPVAIVVIPVLGLWTIGNMRGIHALFGFAVAAPAILIATLWYPRLAMVLAAAILIPAVLWGVSWLADSAPSNPWTLCYATSPPQPAPPGAGSVEVRGEELTCISGGDLRIRAEELLPRTQSMVGAGIFGMVLAGLIMIFRRPRAALYGVGGAPIGLLLVLFVAAINSPDCGR